MSKKISRFVFPSFFIFLTLSFLQCKKDNSTIPNVYVDTYVYLSQPQYSNLNSVGNWTYIEGYGVKGIILYRKSSSEFVAYDRSCPYDPNAANARISVDASNIIGVDNNCGSQFSLFDNSIVKGPANRQMRAYYADYDGSLTVHIHS